MWSLFSRGNTFPYEVQDLVSDNDRTIWKLHKGKKKDNGEEISIFICEGGSATVIDLAKAAVKRLKMLKHPTILKFIDSYESEKSVYLVTEVVTPLMKWLSDRQLSSKNSRNINLLGWGLLQITQGLSFINNDGKLIHNNLNANSVYVTHGGEWKIFGLEYTTADVSYSPIKIIPQQCVYDPPEISSGNKRESSLWSCDMWGLGCLIWEVFNGHSLDNSISLQQTSKIPESLLGVYCSFVCAKPLSRPNPKDVVVDLRKKGQFFHNDLIETLIFLDEIQIKDDAEKHRFFSNLTSKMDNIPDFILRNKVLPALLTVHEFSNLGSVLLTPIFKIGHILEDHEYRNQIVPCVVKMFSSTDRATRLKLLQQMESLSEHLDQKTVNDQIFQPLVTGFQDTNPAIRESTVKALLFLAPKLNYQNLNVEIMKHFARLQCDQGGIRTNTTVCLGKIATHLHPDTRQKCLVSAFTRAMRDPFPPARIAGVTAIGANQQFYPLSDVASKVLPALSHLTLDPEKSVRDAVFKIIKGFLGKLEKVSEDPDLREVIEKEVATASSSSASSWAGWAVGALTSRFYKGPSVKSKSEPNKNSAPSSTETSKSLDEERSVKSLSSEEKSGVSTHSGGYKEEHKLDIVNAMLSYLNTSDEEVGDGWGEEEGELLNLELSDSSQEKLANQDNTKSSLPSMSTYNWGNSSVDDFFTSLEDTKSQSTKLNIRKQASASSKEVSSWDSWGNSSVTESTDDGHTSKLEESKKQREEKRLQRQKEIESKRASRSGPMKLGAKKF